MFRRKWLSREKTRFPSGYPRLQRTGIRKPLRLHQLAAALDFDPELPEPEEVDEEVELFEEPLSLLDELSLLLGLLELSDLAEDLYDDDR